LGISSNWVAVILGVRGLVWKEGLFRYLLAISCRSILESDPLMSLMKAAFLQNASISSSGICSELPFGCSRTISVTSAQSLRAFAL